MLTWWSSTLTPVSLSQNCASRSALSPTVLLHILSLRCPRPYGEDSSISDRCDLVPISTPLCNLLATVVISGTALVAVRCRSCIVTSSSSFPYRELIHPPTRGGG